MSLFFGWPFLVSTLGAFFTPITLLAILFLGLIQKNIKIHRRLLSYFLFTGFFFFLISPNGVSAIILVFKIFLGLTIGRNFEYYLPSNPRVFLALLLISAFIMIISVDRNDLVNANFLVIWTLIAFIGLSNSFVATLATFITFASASRTGFVGLLIVLFLRRGDTKFDRPIKILLALILITLVFSQGGRLSGFFHALTSQQLISIDSIRGFEGSLSTRVRLTQVSLLFESYDLWLVRGFNLEQLEARFSATSTIDTQSFLHSSILLLLATGGVPFLISIGGLLFLYSKHSLSKIDIPLSLIVLLAFSTTMSVEKLYFWIAVGGVVEKISRNRRNSEVVRQIRMSVVI